MGAIVIGAAAGFLCFLAVDSLKPTFGNDDSLDVFGVHGIGGIVGALLTEIFVSEDLGGMGLAEGVTLGAQFWAQLLSVLFTVAYSGILSFIILKIVGGLTGGLRVDEDQEHEGLDLTLHNEKGYLLDV
jgi:Amt family ammonium transporter